MRIVFLRIQNMRTDISILKQLIHSKFEMVSNYLMGRRFLALASFVLGTAKQPLVGYNITDYLFTLFPLLSIVA